MEGGQGPEGVVMEVKKDDVVKIVALPEISAHDESSQPFGIDHMKAPIEDFKRGYWKSSLLVFGVILMAMPLSVVRAEQKGWQENLDQEEYTLMVTVLNQARHLEVIDNQVMVEKVVIGD